MPQEISANFLTLGFVSNIELEYSFFVLDTVILDCVIICDFHGVASSFNCLLFFTHHIYHTSFT